ncbi:MAG: hypothetical protein A3F91_08300 [Flavobacteria bacterium RIFCSPLOWO2_12_FULL_35_11]|nr:MAG: hypothetical protein A3F91_08300 [Flavobacteria bacterium RIFCSPLOWO2_12_FULL_35_11]
MKIEHLGLIGLNFQREKSSGDKNFWVDLVPLLARSLKQITIFSIRNHDVEEERYSINGCNVVIKFLSPTFLETPSSNKKRRIFWKQGAFPSWLGVIEKVLDIKKIRHEMRSFFRENPCQHIHLMDNMGIINRLIVKDAKISVTVSAMAYQGKSPEFLYNFYLKVSYRVSGLTVVPYNEIFQKKLISIGVNPNNICVIPWGVYKNNKLVTSDAEKTEIKRRLGVSPDRPLILWSGYIQQINRRDFLYAYQIAKEALNNGLKATFFFSFKPESFENRFSGLSDHDNRIIVKPTSVDDFQDLRRCCHVFFSPVLNKRVILAPPLTWIELLNIGVPIVTTPVPGTEKIIIQGKTGFLSWTTDGLIKGLNQAINEYPDMKTYCVETANKTFNVENSAERYLKLFNK